MKNDKHSKMTHEAYNGQVVFFLDYDRATDIYIMKAINTNTNLQLTQSFTRNALEMLKLSPHKSFVESIADLMSTLPEFADLIPQTAKTSKDSISTTVTHTIEFKVKPGEKIDLSAMEYEYKKALDKAQLIHYGFKSMVVLVEHIPDEPWPVETKVGKGYEYDKKKYIKSKSYPPYSLNKNSKGSHLPHYAKTGAVKELAETFKNLDKVVKHPVLDEKGALYDCIIDLNDSHGWTREQIADWIESLDFTTEMIKGA